MASAFTWLMKLLWNNFDSILHLGGVKGDVYLTQAIYIIDIQHLLYLISKIPSKAINSLIFTIHRGISSLLNNEE